MQNESCNIDNLSFSFLNRNDCTFHLINDNIKIFYFSFEFILFLLTSFLFFNKISTKQQKKMNQREKKTNKQEICLPCCLFFFSANAVI